MSLKTEIVCFFDYAKTKNVELYNEFSLQHEIGVFLREKMPGYKIQFERNVDTLFSAKVIEKIGEEMIKAEIDITILDPDGKTYAAIELKYPRNKQYPEQMYSFIKDIKFAEQLRRLGFRHACCVVLVDDRLFYSGGRAENGIYQFFRKTFKVPGREYIMKPTGKDEDCIRLGQTHTIEWQDYMWQDVGGQPCEGKFYCIEI